VSSFANPRVYEAVTISTFACSIAAAGPFVTVLATVPIPSASACVFALALAMLSVRGYWRLRGTTLTAPCLWVTAAALSLAAAALLETRLEGINLAAVRYAAAVSTLCPMMAVLGAKRPQDRGWQWVVLTLWIVLIWPAAQAVLLPVGVRLELFVAWKLFLWALIAVGLLNYLPTGNWLAALLVAVGQVLLLHEHIGLLNLATSHAVSIIALGYFCLAAVLVSLASNQRDAKYRSSALPPRHSSLAAHTMDWRTFRDNFGAMWALRVLGRVNQAAELRGWPMRLNWAGFSNVSDQNPTTEQLAELEVTLASLRRRFVEVEPEVLPTSEHHPSA